ncbi:hypothetical protein ABEB36_005966 [Hypothenemus hampei]|uniref:Uncharacterized protein n=1 Tax=Hypothenemus hampei TaxID=57062 RepID=A0ABD1F0P5_HYPHA
MFSEVFLHGTYNTVLQIMYIDRSILKADVALIAFSNILALTLAWHVKTLKIFFQMHPMFYGFHGHGHGHGPHHHFQHPGGFEHFHGRHHGPPMDFWSFNSRGRHRGGRPFDRPENVSLEEQVRKIVSEFFSEGEATWFRHGGRHNRGPCQRGRGHFDWSYGPCHRQEGRVTGEEGTTNEGDGIHHYGWHFTHDNCMFRNNGEQGRCDEEHKRKRHGCHRRRPKRCCHNATSGTDQEVSQTENEDIEEMNNTERPQDSEIDKVATNLQNSSLE